MVAYRFCSFAWRVVSRVISPCRELEKLLLIDPGKEMAMTSETRLIFCRDGALMDSSGQCPQAETRIGPSLVVSQRLLTRP
jgi:hypothetical protein